MAKSKKLKAADIRAYLFMSIRGNKVDVIYEDEINNGAGIGLGLANAMDKDDKLFNIFSAALLSTIESREKKYTSKKKPNPKQMNGVNSDAPFVKTRKTTKK